MAKLYEISKRYKNLDELLDNPELEDAKKAIEQSLNKIDEEFDIKAENIAKIIKSREIDSKGLDEEIKRLQARRKAVGNQIANLKGYLFEHMQMLRKNKIKGNLFTLSIKKNAPAVNIIDEEAVPEKYKIPQPDKLDKVAILEDLKKEIEINGAEIKQTTTLSIR
ncbi:siphovirus Gp157 family protein [Clostridium luticellarii]|jgi:septal ring factor EnvC (AmiA/AmiB activator)|uniref:siphovirus Gp157 family protein n=1 Tax=Clostridium luticellarii TaxID=1691940 RepID=UPI0023552394|nr:siphovirus Gp157 family protein [Clostridium luticellarii]MCI1995655.1 siphovirus Gp157 family protein [Clostridium luticellarii]